MYITDMYSIGSNPLDRRAGIMSAVVLSALGAMFYNLLPIFLGVAQDYRGIDNEGIGLLSSTFFAGFTITTATGFFWIRRINWRKVTLLSLVIASLALLLAGYFQNTLVLMLCIFIAGGAFSTVYGIATTALGDTSHPARWYGLKISSEAMLGALMLFLLPGTLISSHGFMGLMVGMVLAIVLFAPALSWLPGSGHINEEFDSRQITITPQMRLAIGLGLFAVTMFIFSATMVWAFVERIADIAGFETVQTGKIISLSLVFAVLGSFTAVVVGDRHGLGKPLVAATILFVIALAWLATAALLYKYVIGVCLLTFATGLGITYVVTIVAALDRDGRYVVLTVPAIGIGVMVAPAIGGVLITSSEYLALLFVGGIAVLTALLAGLYALHKGMPLKVN